jgi:hypothetical protein
VGHREVQTFICAVEFLLVLATTYYDIIDEAKAYKK